MDLSKYNHTDSVTVNAAPEAVYDLVADVTRIGEFSPVCKSAQWTDDAHTTFTGDNVTPEMQWTTHCRVDVAERGEEFTFTNAGMDGQRDLVRWSFTFAHVGDGCEVTEHWQVLPGYGEFMHSVAPDMDVEAYLDGVVPNTHAGMAETLAKLKAAAEG
jgi:ribosome-associated toxin RatA of RatAB toxin-antitoxin module